MVYCSHLVATEMALNGGHLLTISMRTLSRLATPPPRMDPLLFDFISCFL